MVASRRVAVIGAGPAGMAMVDQLYSLSSTSTCPSPFSVTLFDRRRTFGGVWCYDASPGTCVIRYDCTGRPHALWTGGHKDGDEQGLFRPPGPMYDGLRTNLPCDLMAYRSNPYTAKTPLFPDRATVEDYIQRFAEKVAEKGRGCGLDVRLGTAVSDVRRIQHNKEEAEARVGAGSLWQVTSVSLESGEKKEEVYDHIVLASGRCNTPNLPCIPGLRHFTGEILHSAWWRSPLPFEHKTVLVVGNSSSGSDIARELSGYILRTLPEGEAATQAFVGRCNKGDKVGKVLHSYEHFDKPPPLDYDPREEDSPSWTKRITVVPKITRIEPRDPTGTGAEGSVRARIHFDNGDTRDDVDVIIFATGYVYDFPYLAQSLAPFNTNPLILTSTALPQPSLEGERQGTEAEWGEDKDEVYVPPHPTASYLSNLDDWSLFYAPDPSICVLGAPIRIVPMPFTHVQARIVAATWSSKIGPLPCLCNDIPTTDPTKWSNFTTQHASRQKQDAKWENKTSDLGYPSDTAYQNALLSLLPPQLRLKGIDESRTVPTSTPTEFHAQSEHQTANQKQKQNKLLLPSLQPVTAQHDGWARIPDYRNERRQDTKRLRRLLLGY